jgi:diadenosine tetraphosphate (Ap4A) HIT family hydrolase
MPLKKMKILGIFLSLLGLTFGQINCLEQKSINQDFCVSCALQSGEFEGIGEIVASTQYFEVRQDCYVPIPGFMVIGSKRHVQSIDDFTQEERHDFIDFVYKVRNSMRKTLNIQTVYLIQEEDSKHFHLWLLPRYEWMAERFGTHLESVKPLMLWSQQNLQNDETLTLVFDSIKQLQQSLR